MLPVGEERCIYNAKTVKTVINVAMGVIGHQRRCNGYDASRHGSANVVEHGADVDNIHLAGSGEHRRSSGDWSTV